VAIVLIGGGSRSGKSAKALEIARARGRRLGFIATAQALDDEMRERIGTHRRERGPQITTIEEPIELAEAIERHAAEFDAIVVDCLTIWLSNLILTGAEPRTGELIAKSLASASQIIFVTNEVGCGIVPDNELGRRFRDEAGRLNQRIAEAAAEVYWMIFGCALRVK
jgi:adenosylcobinamide kinase / adenosylcobinamide-phosphate guanylyltransferase